MFCRGGFTNAQALGGHMNIHRRDRARTILQLGFSRHQTLPTLPFYDLTIDPDSAKGWSSSQGGLVANVEQSSEMYQTPSGRPSNELTIGTSFGFKLSSGIR